MFNTIQLHQSRKKKHNFNQAEEIARRIGEDWSLPIDTKVLIRVKKTRPQKDLDSATRQKNLEDAFLFYFGEKSEEKQDA